MGVATSADATSGLFSRTWSDGAWNDKAEQVANAQSLRFHATPASEVAAADMVRATVWIPSELFGPYAKLAGALNVMRTVVAASPKDRRSLILIKANADQNPCWIWGIRPPGSLLDFFRPWEHF